jgi:pimeloyl-ACP methyl ester carboxylesterase
VAGALKLFFFKTQLKMADVNGLKRMSYDTVPCRHVDDLFDLEVRDQRILLLVHGIIGDTQGMAESLRGIGLHRQFDLVLSYDYENLNTPIEDTARRLKQQLDRVGLRAGQGQKITVLAHSMGGLVARWFIEREGGHGLVEHLVMCGTPNRGSPFSRLDEVAHWLDFLKGLAANLMPEHLSPITRIVSHLLKSVAFTDLTKTLDQMRPASAFIHSLNSEADPGVRYTILAGNVRDYQAPANAHFTGLLDKLAKSHSFGLLFDEKPHDIAVALDSITRVSARRLPEQTLDILPVACHHLNYFSSEAGQQALMKAMSRP